MSEAEYEALVELRELLDDIRRASSDVGYGYFPGGDPNDFTPDPECSTEEERARHKAACESFAKDGTNPNPAPHCGLGFLREPPPGFGLGTYAMRDANAEDWAERLARCLDRLGVE